VPIDLDLRIGVQGTDPQAPLFAMFTVALDAR
jgi:hypothetical protein